MSSGTSCSSLYNGVWDLGPADDGPVRTAKAPLSSSAESQRLGRLLHHPVILVFRLASSRSVPAENRSPGLSVTPRFV